MDAEADLHRRVDPGEEHLEVVVAARRALVELGRRVLLAQPLHVVAAEAEVDGRRVHVLEGRMGELDALARHAQQVDVRPLWQKLVHAHRELSQIHGALHH